MWYAARQLFPQSRLVPYPRINRAANPIGAMLTKELSFNLTICGGGTLISPPFYRQLQDLRARSTSLIALGTGIGSPGIETGTAADNDEGLPQLKDCMMQFDELHLRGPYSVNIAQQCGYSKPLTQSGDMVMALTPEDAPTRTGRGVVFIPGYDCVPDVRAYSDKLVRASAAAGHELTFLSMNPLDDERATELGDLYKRPVILSDETPDPDTFMQVIAQFGSMITFRLHGAVYASMLGLPNVLIQTVRKMRDFMVTIEAQDFCIVPDQASVAEVVTLADSRRDVSRIRQACLDIRQHLHVEAARLVSTHR